MSKDIKIIIYLKNFFHYWIWVIKEYCQTQCTLHAASLSFKSLLAVIPFLMASLLILSNLPMFNNWQHEFQTLILNSAIPNVNGDVIIKYINQLTMNRNSIPITASAGLFVVIMLMLRNIEVALNQIWGIKKQRPIIRALITYLIVIIISPLLLLTGMTVSTYILSMQWLDSFTYGYALQLLGFLPILFNMIAFVCVQWLLPYKKIPLKHVIIGALFFAIMFDILKNLFGLYVTNLPTYQMIYGAMAIIPLFMLWVITSWQLFLFSAIVIKGLSHWKIKREE
ncbi:MAG: membrane protein [Francisellaceae bacterium]|jgi:membrane protein